MQAARSRSAQSGAASGRGGDVHRRGHSAQRSLCSALASKSPLAAEHQERVRCKRNSLGLTRVSCSKYISIGRPLTRGASCPRGSAPKRAVHEQKHSSRLLSAGALIIVPRKGDDQNEVHSRLTKTPKPGWGARLGSLLVLRLTETLTFFCASWGLGPCHVTDRNKNQKLRWNSN